MFVLEEEIGGLKSKAYTHTYACMRRAEQLLIDRWSPVSSISCRTYVYCKLHEPASHTVLLLWILLARRWPCMFIYCGDRSRVLLSAMGSKSVLDQDCCAATEANKVNWTCTLKFIPKSANCHLLLSPMKCSYVVMLTLIKYCQTQV